MQIISFSNSQSHKIHPSRPSVISDKNVRLIDVNHDIYCPAKHIASMAVNFGAALAQSEYVPGPVSLYEINRAISANKEGAQVPAYIKMQMPRLERILDLANLENIPIEEGLSINSVPRHGYVDEDNNYVPGKLSQYELVCLGHAYNLGIKIPKHLKWLAKYCAAMVSAYNQSLDDEWTGGVFSTNGLELMKPTVQNLPALLQFIEDVDAADGRPPEYFKSQKAYITADLKRSQHQGSYLLVREPGREKIAALIAYHPFQPRKGLEGFVQEGDKVAELNALYVHPDLQGHHQKLDAGIQTYRWRMSKSLATALYAAMEEWLLIQGYDKVLVETLDQHKRASHFYEKMGYKRIGTTRDASRNQFFVYAKDLLKT